MHCFLYWSYLLGVPIARSVGVPVVVSSRRSLSAAATQHRLLVPWERACDRLAHAVVCNSERRAGGCCPAHRAAPAEGHRDPERRAVASGGHAAGQPAAARRYPREPDSLQGARRRTRRLRAGPCGVAGAGGAAAARGLRTRRRRHCGPRPASTGSTRTSSSSARWPTCPLCWTSARSRCSPRCLRACRTPCSRAWRRAARWSPRRWAACPRSSAGAGVSSSRPATPEALADAMRTLLADPALAARLGAEGRAVVRDGFGIDRMVEESLRLYRGLLAGRPPHEAIAPDDGSSPRHDSRRGSRSQHDSRGHGRPVGERRGLNHETAPAQYRHTRRQAGQRHAAAERPGRHRPPD